jgi:Putative Actinobacterial Holin-X, holin superfamily III
LPDNNGHPDTIANAVTDVTERMSLLVREEIELAKVEMTIKAKSLGRGAAAAAAGAVFGVFAIVIALETLAWGLNSALNSLWLGFLIVLVLLIILTVAAFLFAYTKLKVGPPAPTMALDEAKKIRSTVATTTDEIL